jgi:hypothetical protein
MKWGQTSPLVKDTKLTDVFYAAGSFENVDLGGSVLLGNLVRGDKASRE